MDYVDKNGAVPPAPFLFVACSEAKAYLSVVVDFFFFLLFFFPFSSFIQFKSNKQSDGNEIIKCQKQNS